MMKVHALALGDYQTNCYIIHDETSKSCCIIDPGYDADFILNKLDSLGLTLEAILLTHGHFDHVGAVKELAAETGCDVYLHPDDLSMPPRPYPRQCLPVGGEYHSLRRYVVPGFLRPHRPARR